MMFKRALCLLILGLSACSTPVEEPYTGITNAKCEMLSDAWVDCSLWGDKCFCTYHDGWPAL